MLVAPPIGAIALYFLVGWTGGLIALWLLGHTLWRWWRQRVFPVDLLNWRTLTLATVALLCSGLTAHLIWHLVLLCVLCTLWLLAGVQMVRRQGVSTAGAGAQTDATQPYWHRWQLVLAAVVTLVCYALLGYGLLLHYQWQLEQHYEESRRHFLLPRAMPYGELLIPAGSLIYRFNDYPQDSSPQPRPLTLTHLYQVRFAQPVPVGSIWASALQLHDPRETYELELARDQHIGPVLLEADHELEADHDNASAQTAWRIDPHRPTLHCRKGEVATFAIIPTSGLDAPPGQEDSSPDGTGAHFSPSRWGITRCSPGTIDVPPAYTGPAPWGADMPAWAEQERKQQPSRPG